MSTLLANHDNILQKYASNKANFLGRYFLEKSSNYRSEYQRDRDRVIHCSSFRRLKQKPKFCLS